jgi:hypothetical protein
MTEEIFKMNQQELDEIMEGLTAEYREQEGFYWRNGEYVQGNTVREVDDVAKRETDAFRMAINITGCYLAKRYELDYNPISDK